MEYIHYTAYVPYSEKLLSRLTLQIIRKGIRSIAGLGVDGDSIGVLEVSKQAVFFAGPKRSLNWDIVVAGEEPSRAKPGLEDIFGRENLTEHAR